MSMKPSKNTVFDFGLFNYRHKYTLRVFTGHSYSWVIPPVILFSCICIIVSFLISVSHLLIDALPFPLYESGISSVSSHGITTGPNQWFHNYRLGYHRLAQIMRRFKRRLNTSGL
jgi:hypothetical protein